MQFGLSFQVPDAEGTILHFPTIQSCEEGATSWIEIPVEGEDEPAEPAPTVRIVAGTGGGHGSSSTDGEDQGDDATTDGNGAPGNDGSDDGDSSGNGLAITGLIAGLGGLGLGGAAFAKSRG